MSNINDQADYASPLQEAGAEVPQAQKLSHDAESVMSLTYGKKFPVNLWPLLREYVGEEADEGTKQYRQRLSHLHDEFLGSSRQTFDLRVQELEDLYVRYRISGNRSFEKFLSSLLSYREVHEPLEAELAAIDVDRAARNLPPYKVELQKVYAYLDEACRNADDAAMAEALRAEFLSSFVDYVSTVRMNIATFEAWRCIGWAVRFRGVPLEFVIAANAMINLMLQERFHAGVQQMRKDFLAGAGSELS